MKSNILLIAINTLLFQLSCGAPCTPLPCKTASDLSLMRCGIAEKDASASQITQILRTKQTKQPLTKKLANEIMTQVVDAINREDASVLAQYLDQGNYGVEFANAAFADYKYYFKGGKIIKFELDIEEATEENQVRSKHFKYKIYSSTGISKKIFIYQDSTVHTVSAIKVTDDFLFYSFRAKNFLGAFIKYVQQNNPQKLARVLSPDDIDYPVVKAKKVILNYKDKFDVNTLKYRFDGVESRTEYFLYTIYGFKGKKAVEHEVKITHGDGLLGSEDELIPWHEGY